MTPDPAIQAEIDVLNAQLQPILGTTVGQATKAIPRSDQCGRADGRLCKSLIGNVVTDSMRDRLRLDRRAVRDHEFGRPARRADLPGRWWRDRVLPHRRATSVPLSPGARCWRSCRSATSCPR